MADKTCWCGARIGFTASTPQMCLNNPEHDVNDRTKKIDPFERVIPLIVEPEVVRDTRWEKVEAHIRTVWFVVFGEGEDEEGWYEDIYPGPNYPAYLELAICVDIADRHFYNIQRLDMRAVERMDPQNINWTLDAMCSLIDDDLEAWGL